MFLNPCPVLSIEETDHQSVEYGIRHCQDMANIISRLINDGKYRRHRTDMPDIYIVLMGLDNIVQLFRQTVVKVLWFYRVKVEEE